MLGIGPADDNTKLIQWYTWRLLFELYFLMVKNKTYVVGWQWASCWAWAGVSTRFILKAATRTPSGQFWGSLKCVSILGESREETPRFIVTQRQPKCWIWFPVKKGMNLSLNTCDQNSLSGM